MATRTAFLGLSLLLVLTHYARAYVIIDTSLYRSLRELKMEFARDFGLEQQLDLSVRMLMEKSEKALVSRDTTDPSIPDLVKQLGLTDLLDLVGKANLASTLSGKGPFTVFGPTNDAFKNLPDWVKEAIKDKKVLKDVLLFHVLAARVMSSDLQNELLVATADDGKKLRVNLYTTDNGQVATAQCAPIDLSRVDNEASNGVVHVLNAVMIPPSGNIVETAVECPIFQTLVKAVKAASLVDALSGEGPFTLFAPTDDAFDALPDGFLEQLLQDVDKLTKVLLYHVLSGTYCSAGLSSGNVTTLAQEDVTINLSGGVSVNGANVIAPDGSVTNGVIHAIDAVLIPPDLIL